MGTLRYLMAKVPGAIGLHWFGRSVLPSGAFGGLTFPGVDF